MMRQEAIRGTMLLLLLDGMIIIKKKIFQVIIPGYILRIVMVRGSLRIVTDLSGEIKGISISHMKINL